MYVCMYVYIYVYVYIYRVNPNPETEDQYLCIETQPYHSWRCSD